MKNVVQLFAPGLARRCKMNAVLALACGGLVLGALGHSDDNTVVLDTSFESGQTRPPALQHQVVSDKSHTGSNSLFSQVSEPKRACILHVPFQAKAGTELKVSFHVFGDKGPGAALFVRVGEERIRLANAELKPQWQEVLATHAFAKDTEGAVEIIAPSSYGGKVGRAWVDDVLVSVRQPVVLNYRTELQSFPALAFDQAGSAWLAAVERLTPRRLIGVFRIENKEPRKVCSLEAPDLTGVAAPAVAGLAKGCLVVFPAEQQDRWGLAYAFFQEGAPSGAAHSFQLVPCRGNANINPALAVAGNRAWAVWESNADGYRAIYGCCIEPGGCGTPQRLSAPDVNSYNPAIVALEDGSLFAAWDSIRGAAADLYGAAFRDGQWQAERRLTFQSRLARHPHLATWKNQVWIAFQAQGYQGIKVNKVDEQLVAVARLDGDRLSAPKGLFAQVSKPLLKLMRPRIAFDPEGRLWLSARQSISQHDGWSPLLWCYSGSEWTKPMALLDAPGRWQAVPLAFAPEGGLAAVQFDEVPGKRDKQASAYTRRFGVHVASIARAEAPAAHVLETEPLQMPATEFSLAVAEDLVAASFPRVQRTHAGRSLKAFFGDFHDHTDLSICGRSVNPPGHDLFANVRDIERLDFVALTDHDYDFDQSLWDYNGEQTRNNHDPGRFVTFLGHEWTSSKNPGLKPGDPNRYGHHNFIFLNPHFNRFFNSYAGDISPADVWKELEGVSFICIPHELCDWQHKGQGNPPTDWTFVDEVLQPVAEIFQARGSYEYLGCPRQSATATPFKGYFIQDAWAKEIVIGVIASPDHGGGSGKVGVWAEELTRESLFEAVRARHTFGTSGAKMSLFFSSGDILMGDKVSRPGGAIAFQIQARALRDITELVIFRNNQIVFRQEPGKKEVEIAWTDEQPPAGSHMWYYARIQTADDELAWTSPIWFSENPPQRAKR